MNPFWCVIDLEGGLQSIDRLGEALPAMHGADGQIEVLTDGPLGGMFVPSAVLQRPTAAFHNGVLALGNVRLTNRAELLGDRALSPEMTDLEVVSDHLRRKGAAGIRDLVGDFAFILWDTRRNRLIAARDALGIKELFFRRRGSEMVFASHLDCFEGGDYDREYISEFLGGFSRSTSRTIYAGISRLEAGHFLEAEGTSVRIHRYWDPSDFVPAVQVKDLPGAVEEFRFLFAEGVKAALSDGLPTWSQLSGGLDSSSVVGMACHLYQKGEVAQPLGGTASIVDSLGQGDETRYSNAVAQRYGLINERIVDYWPWRADSRGLPRDAEPRVFLPFYARDREMVSRIRAGGGAVLLSGYGSDNYLTGPLDFVADDFRQGRFKEGLSTLVDAAVATRRSFWQLLGLHGIAPLAPQWVRNRLRPEILRGLDWLDEGFARQYDITGVMNRDNLARKHGVFADQTAIEIGSIASNLDRGPCDDETELRYPFLHRPLVEFSLRLPPTLRVRPGREKWILREAVGDLLPDCVRNRQGKGAIDSRVSWALQRERPLLEKIVEHSHLAALGIVDPQKLTAAFENARNGKIESVAMLFPTLALESWLAIKSGLWGPATGLAGAEGQELEALKPKLGEYQNVEAFIH